MGNNYTTNQASLGSGVFMWQQDIQICVNVWKSQLLTHNQGGDGANPGGRTFASLVPEFDCFAWWEFSPFSIITFIKSTLR